MSAAAWRAAGAASVRFNCPLGAGAAPQRARQFAAGLPAGSTVVDLGCGRAELLALVVDAVPDGRGIGIDLVVGASPHPRVGLVEGDAAGWRSPDPASGALCVGSTHVLGGWGAVWAYLAAWPSLERVLVADVVWVDTPGADALDRFGALPAGPQGAASLAEAAGWSVVDTSVSSLEEWDEFERSWGDGVRALGTAEAVAFAEQRWALYEAEHRGVLGFAWVTARRVRSFDPTVW
jgi:hypothetical protein